MWCKGFTIIRKRGLKSSIVGSVKWKWKNDDGESHNRILKMCSTFPNHP